LAEANQATSRFYDELSNSRPLTFKSTVGSLVSYAFSSNYIYIGDYSSLTVKGQIGATFAVLMKRRYKQFRLKSIATSNGQ
jgi:hypothetical protein